MMGLIDSGGRDRTADPVHLFPNNKGFSTPLSTLGSWLAAEGASLILIGKTLGHSNVSTSAIYARLNQDPVRKALEANSLKMLGIKPKKKAKKKRSQKVDR
jgi:hypothetical protein